MSRQRSKSGKVQYLMISAVAERFEIHPQTLRLYEREGLISPARSGGNTRLYDQETLERLEIVLTLTRELGVNLAGVEVVLNMREQMDKMRQEMDDALLSIKQQAAEKRASRQPEHALVKVRSGPLVKVRSTRRNRGR